MATPQSALVPGMTCTGEPSDQLHTRTASRVKPDVGQDISQGPVQLLRGSRIGVAVERGCLLLAGHGRHHQCGHCSGAHANRATSTAPTCDTSEKKRTPGGAIVTLGKGISRVLISLLHFMVALIRSPQITVAADQVRSGQFLV